MMHPACAIRTPGVLDGVPWPIVGRSVLDGGLYPIVSPQRARRRAYPIVGRSVLDGERLAEAITHIVMEILPRYNAIT